MSAELRTGYDDFPYRSQPLPQTHPDHLATVGAQFGFDAADVGRCRLLEIGCAAGGNLIPLAASLPDSTFVGIDLSPVQPLARGTMRGAPSASLRHEPVALSDEERALLPLLDGARTRAEIAAARWAGAARSRPPASSRRRARRAGRCALLVR
ncbi:MAG: hypothetical protein ACREYD_15615 [Casimicrobiaceae bacterium]